VDPLSLFLRQHAIAHAAAMAGEGECEWSFQDALLAGLRNGEEPPPPLRACPRELRPTA